MRTTFSSMGISALPQPFAAAKIADRDEEEADRH
jgi:hypothetical protein